MELEPDLIFRNGTKTGAEFCNFEEPNPELDCYCIYGQNLNWESF